MTGPITGTFIDEITYDIPASNWTKKEWCRDLDNMKKISRCFDIVARSSPNNFSLHDQILSELDGILLTMDKTIQNNR